MSANLKAARSVRDISHLFLSCAEQLPEVPLPLVVVPSLAAGHDETTAGCIIVDQDRIIRQINAMARRFLNLLQDEPVGQVFALFISPNTIQHISIQRQNGQPGIGRMAVSSGDAATNTLLTISIQDITSP